jgi:hypothetical protein
MDAGNGTDNSQNGDGNGKVYVRFGPLPTQEMPREWAEKMLTAWRERNASQFGKFLAEAATAGR